MRKKLTIGAFFCFTLSFSQVGINTINPKGIFNVDGAKDNPASGNPNASQQLNDFVVDSAGKVGIGTTTPSQKLEIQTGGTSSSPMSGFKLVDGTQYDKYVLTSDVNGVATWKPTNLITVFGSFPSSTGAGSYSFKTDTLWYQTGANITLPPGKWRVDVIQLLRITGDPLPADAYMWMRFSFTEDNISVNPAITNNFIGSGKYVSGLVFGPTVTTATKYGLAQGSVLINNSTSSAKTYYLVAGSSTSSITTATTYLSTVGSNQWGENIISAFPINF